ncbi:MAG TPA: SHOCT domain-containing protein [Desulfosarcina sp.]|nr:SHOCT domain-containing protein [Desulfosarcina sp.]
MMKKRWFAIGLPGLSLLVSGCSRRPGGGGYMQGWDHMMGPGAYGGMFMWLLVIVVIAVVLYLVFNRNRTGGDLHGGHGEAALDILKRRYAKGEISRDDFDRMKRDIGE